MSNYNIKAKEEDYYRFKILPTATFRLKINILEKQRFMKTAEPIKGDIMKEKIRTLGYGKPKAKEVGISPNENNYIQSFVR